MACIVGSKSALYRHRCLLSYESAKQSGLLLARTGFGVSSTFRDLQLVATRQAHYTVVALRLNLLILICCFCGGMSSAALTVTPATLCTSGRKAAVATYSRALSGLRLALGTSVAIPVPRSSRYHLASSSSRCYSTSVAAPPKASSQQVRFSAHKSFSSRMLMHHITYKQPCGCRLANMKR